MLEEADDWYDNEQRSQHQVTKDKHQNQEHDRLPKHEADNENELKAAEPPVRHELDTSDTLILPGHHHIHLEANAQGAVHPLPQVNLTFRDDQSFFHKDAPEAQSQTSSKEGETRKSEEQAEGVKQRTTPAPSSEPETLFSQRATTFYAGTPGHVENGNTTSQPRNWTGPENPKLTAKTPEHGGPTVRPYSTNKTDVSDLNNQTAHTSSSPWNPPNTSESQASDNLVNLRSHHTLSPGGLAGLSSAILFLISIPIIIAIFRCRRRRQRRIDVTFEEKKSDTPEAEQSGYATAHLDPETGRLSPYEIQDFMNNVAAFQTQQRPK